MNNHSLNFSVLDKALIDEWIAKEGRTKLCGKTGDRWVIR